MTEYKSFDAEFKDPGDDSGMVDLYAAVFGNVDRSGEVIQPGAFKNIDEFKRSGWMAINHDWERLGVATIEDAHQDEKGLRIRAHFHSTPEAQAVRTTIRERIARGKGVKASIGYKVLDDESIKLDGKSIRSLKAIDLYEASVVNMPANDRADVVQAKALMGLDEARSFVADFKAGRVLSSANVAAMRRWAEQARSYAALADEITALCDQHDAPAAPDYIPHQGDKSFVTPVELYHEFLAISEKIR